MAVVAVNAEPWNARDSDGLSWPVAAPAWRASLDSLAVEVPLGSGAAGPAEQNWRESASLSISLTAAAPY